MFLLNFLSSAHLLIDLESLQVLQNFFLHLYQWSTDIMLVMKINDLVVEKPNS